MKRIVSIFVFAILCFVTLSNISAEEYEEYKSGDLVRYNNIAFYVLFDSDSNEDSVQLLKMVPLTHEEIDKYTDGKAYYYIFNDGEEFRNSDKNLVYGNMSYYYSTSCSYKRYRSYTDTGEYYENYSGSNSSGCTNDYDSSNVKKVVDAWTQEFIKNDDLVAFEDGYNSRLLYKNEITTNEDELDSGYLGESTPLWLWKLSYYSWIMDASVANYDAFVLFDKRIINQNLIYAGSVRPTIKLKKSSINKVSFNEYHNNAVREYKIGDIINYNDTKFYVIKDSSESDSTVTLLKDKPLTKYELETYGEGYINNYIYSYNGNILTPGTVIFDNGFNKVAYLSTDKCYYNSSNNSLDYSGCNQNYDVSNVKHIVDNWLLGTINVSDTAIDEKGYSSGLINSDDLINLGYINIQANTTGKDNFKAGNDTPEFMLNENTKGMLTMIPSYLYTDNGYNDYGIAIADDDYSFVAKDIPNRVIGTVRPVVTLNKKEIAPKITNVEEIEDTVSRDTESNNIEVDIETNVDNSNVVTDMNTNLNNSLSVVVPNTLSSKNIVLIIIGIIVLAVGVVTFIKFKRK